MTTAEIAFRIIFHIVLFGVVNAALGTTGIMLIFAACAWSLGVLFGVLLRSYHAS